MSAGRRSVAFSDLQRAAQCGAITTVTSTLLGTEAPVVAPDPQWVERLLTEAPGIDRHLDHDRGGEAWAQPADWQWRTTPHDVLVEAADLARERLPMALSVLVDNVAFGTGGDVAMSSQERSAVEAAVRVARREVLRTLPSRPARKTKTKNMPPRWDGPCTSVVTWTPDGRVLVDGEEGCEVPGWTTRTSIDG